MNIEYESNGNKNYYGNLYGNVMAIYHQTNILIKLNLTWEIIDLQNFDTRKIQLTVVIKFVSSKGTEEECLMYSNSSNIKFTSYNGENELLINFLSHFVQNIKII